MLREDAGRQRLALWAQWLAGEAVWSSPRVWDWVLDAALSVGLADYANIQLVHPRLRGLELVAQRGFQRPFLEYFRFVADENSACGWALTRQRPVMVEDVADSPLFANRPQLEVMLDAGIRAVKSLPLIGSEGRVLGMLSVHYRQPNGQAPGTSQSLKVLARTIGLAMERAIGVRDHSFVRGLKPSGASQAAQNGLGWCGGRSGKLN